MKKLLPENSMRVNSRNFPHCQGRNLPNVCHQGFCYCYVSPILSFLKGGLNIVVISSLFCHCLRGDWTPRSQVPKYSTFHNVSFIGPQDPCLQILDITYRCWTLTCFGKRLGSLGGPSWENGEFVLHVRKGGQGYFVAGGSDTKRDVFKFSSKSILPHGWN